VILNNLQLIEKDGTVNIKIDEEKITSLSDQKYTDDSMQLHFENALAVPGLINSHDHLEFNCFPQLGSGRYDSYIDWAMEIQKEHKNKVNEVLEIPKDLRVEWGIYKNLIAGVTTVVHHGYFNHTDPLINVVTNVQNLHSVGFEKYWKLKLNNPLQLNRLCVIHAGEGMTKDAGFEIDQLIRNNFLKRDMVAVHAVAMKPQQSRKFRAVIWCPDSNNFLFQKTADVAGLKGNTSLCFGTDSTLSAGWNYRDHLRLARKYDTSDRELFDMATVTPAKLWKLNCGELSENKNADIVICRSANNSLDSFYGSDPFDILMVIQKGKIRLFDESLYLQLKDSDFNFLNFGKFMIDGAVKYVEGNISSLMRKIKGYYPGAMFPITPAA
jgi:cytosine/adenosine deaminase-related metal-dependent hydrolase